MAGANAPSVRTMVWPVCMSAVTMAMGMSRSAKVRSPNSSLMSDSSLLKDTNPCRDRTGRAMCRQPMWLAMYSSSATLRPAQNIAPTSEPTLVPAR